MEVSLVLKNWGIKQDAETKLPKLVGSFGVMAGEKEISSQEFNEGYTHKKVTFSPGLTTKIQTLEAEIQAELTQLLS